MRATHLRAVERAAETMRGTVRQILRQDGEITASVVNREGAEITTSDYDEALDILCGGEHKNRVVDSISGRRAAIVGAEDTLTGRLLCRLCYLSRPGRMGDRYNPLAPRQLVEFAKALQQDFCEDCGRDLL